MGRCMVTITWANNAESRCTKAQHDDRDHDFYCEECNFSNLSYTHNNFCALGILDNHEDRVSIIRDLLDARGKED